MENVLYIAGAIACLALAALFIYLITLIRGAKSLVDGVNETVQNLTGEIRHIREDLDGTLKNVEGITGELQISTRHINTQLGEVDGIIANVGRVTNEVTSAIGDATDILHEGKRVVVSLIDLEQQIQQNVSKPVVETLGILGAVGRGIQKVRRQFEHALEGAGVESAEEASLRTETGAPTDAAEIVGGRAPWKDDPFIKEPRQPSGSGY